MASLLWVPVIFAVASWILYTVSTNLPDLTQYSQQHNVSLSFPSSLDELQSVSALLSRYQADHQQHVLLLFSLSYLYKQTFAIPGSVFLNVLAGSLFGLHLGFPITCMLSALGATCCYFLSKYFGTETVNTYFPEKVSAIKNKVDDNRQGLFFFLLFLRLFPMTPNWFLNVTSPILNIPPSLFFLSVLIGLMPYNYICVETGCLLSRLTNINDVMSLQTCIKLAGIALAALVPGVLVKRYHKQHQQ